MISEEEAKAASEKIQAEFADFARRIKDHGCVAVVGFAIIANNGDALGHPWVSTSGHSSIDPQALLRMAASVLMLDAENAPTIASVLTPDPSKLN